MSTELSQSPLTSEEKSVLRTNSASSVRWEIARAMIWAFFFISLISFAVLFSLWRWLELVPNPAAYRDYFIVISVLLSAGFLLKICWNDVRNVGKGGAKIDLNTKDIKNGVANVLISDVRRVVEIKEYEDEGAGFFLELDDGRVLCVIGQDLYDYAHDAEFEEGEPDVQHLFRKPASNIVLHLQAAGV